MSGFHKSNATVLKTSVGKGQTIVEPMGGIDKSSAGGSAKDERKLDIGGSTTNLSHSLGTSLSERESSKKSKFD